MLVHSVRVRLTLWNVLILAAVLSGFGAALCYAVQANQSAAIDRDIAERARGMAQRGPGGGPPRMFRAFRRDEPGQPGGPSPEDREGPGGPEMRPEQIVPMLQGGQGVLQPWMGPEGGRDGRDGRRGGGPEGFGRGPRRELQVRLPGDVGPAPNTDANGQQVREYRRPLFFGQDGKASGFFADDLPWDRAALDQGLRGSELYSTVSVDGEKVRVFTTPARRDGVIHGVVQTAHPLGEQRRLVESQLRTLLTLIPMALLVAGLGGLFLTNRALQPVRDMTQAAAQIGAGDLSRRLKVNGRDELAELALTFNAMISRLDHAFEGLGTANRELEAAYKRLESAYQEQRRFTGDASHELRTPLTRIKGSTSLALCGPHDADSYREALEVADEAADVMAKIVQDLLLLARADAGQLPVRLRPTPVADVLRQALGRMPEESGARIDLDIPADALVMADPDHLARLFINLLENARRHTPESGSIHIAAREMGSVVSVSVTDTGEGIPPEHLPHVQERFYRVDAARTGGRGGTGLGLAICRSIIEAHQGEMTIQSRVGEGTTVTVTLLAAQHAALERARMPSLMA